MSFAGFRQTGVRYVRDERFAGETKYPLKKMMNFAVDATTSFSKKPLKLAGYVGLFLSMASFVYLFITIYLKLFTQTTVSGWASILCVSLFFQRRGSDYAGHYRGIYRKDLRRGEKSAAVYY